MNIWDWLEVMLTAVVFILTYIGIVDLLTAFGVW